MIIQELHNRLIGFLRRRCPEIELESKIVSEKIHIIIDNTLVCIDTKEKLFYVSGKASQISYAMGRKIGSVYSSHWCRQTQATTVRFSRNFKFFPEKAEVFLLFTALFKDLELSNYFLDKDCLLEVSDEGLNVKVYVTKDICVLVAKDLSGAIKPITIEIGDKEMIETFEDPKSDKTAKEKGKKLLEEEKDKVVASKDGERTAVYGDSVEGSVEENGE